MSLADQHAGDINPLRDLRYLPSGYIAEQKRGLNGFFRLVLFFLLVYELVYELGLNSFCI